jgi:hypothetical protein
MSKTIQDGSKLLGTFPGHVRQAFLKQTPDQYIVCAIPSARATAKMAVSEEYIVHCYIRFSEYLATADCYFFRYCLVETVQVFQ